VNRIMDDKTRLIAELRRDVDRYRDALVKLVITCEQAAQPLPRGLLGHVDPKQFDEIQTKLRADAVIEARAVIDAPGWVARLCEPEVRS